MGKLAVRPGWLRDFRHWLEQSGYSPASTQAYGSRLQRLSDWLDTKGWELTRLAEPGILEEFFQSRTPLGIPSREQFRSAVNNWLRYAREVGLVDLLPPVDLEARPLKSPSWLEAFAKDLRQQGYRRAVILRPAINRPISLRTAESIEIRGGSHRSGLSIFGESLRVGLME